MHLEKFVVLRRRPKISVILESMRLVWGLWWWRLPKKRRTRREWHRRGESAVTGDWDSKECKIRRMGAKWVQGRLVRGGECYLTEELDTTVVRYRSSVMLLVHRRLPQCGMKICCA